MRKLNAALLLALALAGCAGTQKPRPFAYGITASGLYAADALLYTPAPRFTDCVVSFGVVTCIEY